MAHRNRCEHTVEFNDESETIWKALCLRFDAKSRGNERRTIVNNMKWREDLNSARIFNGTFDSEHMVAIADDVNGAL